MDIPTEKFIYLSFVCYTNKMKNSLLENMKMLISSANLVYQAKDYTSATILYFKLAFSVLDYVILAKKGLAPKDHTERFRILQKDFPEEYEFLDKYFDIYRDTYSATIEKEKCDKVKENVERIIKKHKIPV